MHDLFDLLPIHFFNVLSSNSDNVENIKLLFYLYEYSYNDAVYDFSIDEFKDMIVTYLTKNPKAVFFEIEEYKTIQDRANVLYRRFREAQWFEEEQVSNYERRVHFNDYALAILKTLYEISGNNTTEYSGLVYGIYKITENFNELSGWISLEDIENRLRILVSKLNELKVGIKKYIQRFYSKGILNDANSILDNVLNEYQNNVIDKAFYNLKTIDNPEKYRLKIIDTLEGIYLNKSVKEMIVIQGMERTDKTKEDVEEILENRFDFIFHVLDLLNNLIDEIDLKNKKYLSVARARFQFLMSDKKDLEGNINSILKKIDSLEQISTEISRMSQFNQISIIDDDSLFVQKVQMRIKKSKITRETQFLTEDELEIIRNKYMKDKRFSKKTILSLVQQKLAEKDDFKATELPLNTSEDYIRVICTYLYAGTSKSAYVVEELNEMVNINGYHFKEFIVRRA